MRAGYARTTFGSGAHADNILLAFWETYVAQMAHSTTAVWYIVRSKLQKDLFNQYIENQITICGQL